VAENLRTLRRKRQIVGEIRQITRAMKLVSAVKLKRAMTAREHTGFFSAQLSDAVEIAAAEAGRDLEHPYLTGRPVQHVGLLVIAGDKGLCGAFNSNIIGRARQFAGSAKADVVTCTVGGRTAEMSRRARLHVQKQFAAVSDKLRGQDAQQVASYMLRLYDTGEVDEVHVCYGRFVSRMTQQPDVVQLLPLEIEPASAPSADRYLFEPPAGRLLVDLLPMLVRALIHHLLVETAASEHSARLAAMTAATENAEEMIEGLTRQINRARQAQITRELLDVVSGADALQSQV